MRIAPRSRSKRSTPLSRGLLRAHVAPAFALAQDGGLDLMQLFDQSVRQETRFL